MAMTDDGEKNKSITGLPYDAQTTIHFEKVIQFTLILSLTVSSSMFRPSSSVAAITAPQTP